MAMISWSITAQPACFVMEIAQCHSVRVTKKKSGKYLDLTETEHEDKESNSYPVSFRRKRVRKREPSHFFEQCSQAAIVSTLFTFVYLAQ